MLFSLFVIWTFFAVGGIIIHELGHYVSQRRMGAYPEFIDIGVGPRLIRFRFAGGRSLFILRLIPFSGMTDVENLSRLHISAQQAVKTLAAGSRAEFGFGLMAQSVSFWYVGLPGWVVCVSSLAAVLWWTLPSAAFWLLIHAAWLIVPLVGTAIFYAVGLVSERSDIPLVIASSLPLISALLQVVPQSFLKDNDGARILRIRKKAQL